MTLVNAILGRIIDVLQAPFRGTSPRGPLTAPQAGAPVTARAYGSSRMMEGSKRWPRCGW